MNMLFVARAILKYLILLKPITLFSTLAWAINKYVRVNIDVIGIVENQVHVLINDNENLLLQLAAWNQLLT